MITPKDCKYDDRIDLPDGRFLKVSFPPDDSHGAPWEECEGHGPVREIRSRDQKAPGERIIGYHRDHAYDFAGAMELARKDGWGLCEKDLAALRYNLKREPTKGEIRAAAVEADIAFLDGYLSDRWCYVVVSVELFSPDGSQLAADYLGGVESCGDYAAETAAEMANTLIEADDKERAESAYWLEREVQTA